MICRRSSNPLPHHHEARRPNKALGEICAPTPPPTTLGINPSRPYCHITADYLGPLLWRDDMKRYDLSRNYRHGIGMPEIIECADGRFVRWEDAQRMREALQGLLNALPSATTHPAIKAARTALSQEQEK